MKLRLDRHWPGARLATFFTRAGRDFELGALD